MSLEFEFEFEFNPIFLTSDSSTESSPARRLPFRENDEG